MTGDAVILDGSKITAVKVGSATVTVTAGGVSDSIQITVPENRASGVTLTPSADQNIKVGESVKLQVSVEPANTTDQLSWSVDGGAVILKDGTVTGLEAGDATVTVTVGNVSASVSFHVSDVLLEGIQNVTMQNTDTQKVTMNPADATQKVVRWEIAPADLAAISADGVITPLKTSGKGVIKAYVAGQAEPFTAQLTIEENVGPHVIFVKDDGTEIHAQNGVFHLTSGTRGKFVLKNAELDLMDGWVCEENIVDKDGLNSVHYWISTDGTYNPRGAKTISAKVVTMNHGTLNFTIQNTASGITQLRVTIDGQTADENHPYRVAGMVNNVPVRVEGLQDGQWISVAPSMLKYTTSDSVGGVRIVDGYLRMSEGKNATLTVALEEDPSIQVSFHLESSYVPVSGIHVSVPDQFAIDGWNGLGGYYVGIQPHSGYNVSFTPGNASKRDVVWEALTPDIATHMEEFSNGIIPKKAGTARFKVTSRDNPGAYQIVEVTFVYKNPVQSVTLPKTEYSLNVGSTEILNFKFNPGNATEQRFNWSYSQDGIVSVNTEVSNDPNVAGSKWFTTTLLGIKPGKVTVTGTPVDITGGAESVTFTVTVGGGSQPTPYQPVDVSVLLQHGLDALKFASHSAYEDEWTIFPLLRAGGQLSDNDRILYLQSVKKELQSGKSLQPTDYARIILTLTVMGIDSRNFQGMDIIEMMCCDPDFFNKTSNQMLWALIALDSHDFAVPEGAGFTRDQLVDTLLKYQRKDGSFSLGLSDPTGSIDMTAMMLQGLARYQYRRDVKAAIEKGLEYLMGKITADAGFINEGGENSCSAAQVITALTALGKDPSNPANGFVRNGKNMISRLEVFRLSTGYTLLAGGKDPDLMFMQQITYALESYRRMIEEENSLYDLTDIDIGDVRPEDVDNQKIANAVIEQIAAFPKKPTQADFGAIYLARQAYESLSDAQKALVTNYQKLADAEQYLEDSKVAGRVSDMIGRLPGNITAEHKNQVIAARNAYDKLTGAQKAMVTNLDVLVKAEMALHAHNQNPGDNPVVDNVQNAVIADGIVSADQFAAVQGKDKLLVIRYTMDNGRTYTLKIIGRDVRFAENMDVTVLNSSTFEKEMNRLSVDPVIFTFRQQGRFPGQMKVEMPVELSDGAYFLMRYNPDEMRLEKVDRVDVAGGMAEFLLEEGGSYLLAKKVSMESLKDADKDDTVTPTETPDATAPETETPDRSSSISAGAIVGIVAAAVVIAGAVIYICVIVKKKKG